MTLLQRQRLRLCGRAAAAHVHFTARTGCIPYHVQRQIVFVKRAAAAAPQVMHGWLPMALLAQLHYVLIDA